MPSPYGLNGKSALRKVKLEIPIKPVNGLSSSRIRKIAQANDSVPTKREIMTTRLVGANNVKLRKIALSQNTRMTRNGAGIEIFGLGKQLKPVLRTCCKHRNGTHLQ